MSQHIPITKSLALEHPSTGYRMTEEWGWGLSPAHPLVAAMLGLLTSAKTKSLGLRQGLDLGFLD